MVLGVLERQRGSLAQKDARRQGGGRRGAQRESGLPELGQRASHHHHETVIPLDCIFILDILYFLLLPTFGIYFAGFIFILYHLPFISLSPFSLQLLVQLSYR